MTRALVVDDKEENLYYLRALLVAHGWQVESARNGHEALAKAREARPDVVVSDLLMPGMDGFTLLRQWKSDASLSATPFVVYTATYTSPDDEQLARKLGADAFILKPVEPEALFVRLDAVRASRANEPAPAGSLEGKEETLLREYNQALVRKLEDKMLQLEESNRSLQRDIAARERAEAALRESEASFRLLVESIPQLVWISRPEGTVVFTNRQWAAYTGRSCPEHERDAWTKAFHPDDRVRADRAWKEATSTGQPLAVEARLRSDDGTYRWFLVRSVPFRDAAGAIAKWFGTCTDVEEMKQAAARVQRAEEQLRQAQKMEAIGQLAAGVAHDFNNLLSIILSYSSFILEGLAPSHPLRNDVEEVRRAGERAAGLTRHLLAFSRQKVLKPRSLDLAEVVKQLEKMLQRVLREDVRLTIHAPDGVGTVMVDPSHVEQILLNLIVNARDAMPNGGSIVVELANATLDAAYAADHHGVVPGRYVMLAVRDTGCGMDAATRARIFEPFFTTKPIGQGTGLGLATVYGAVAQSGGHVAVESEPGVGTTFKIYFPRRDDAPPASVREPPEPAALRGTETILLVEDADDLRTLMRSILSRAGYDVIEASTPGEALLASEQHRGPIHLLVTDVVMPRMNGSELAERVCRARPDLRVLYTSGYSEEAIVAHGVVEAGASFLPKPITRESLLVKTREVLASAPHHPRAVEPSASRVNRPVIIAREHVLHVDVEASMVDLTARILGRLGYRVSGFTDPRAAVGAFEADPGAFDAVVTEVTMPGMSGFDLVRRVRQTRAEIPIVLTSAYFRPEDVREAEALGLRALLVKPDTVEELGLVLRDELARSRKRRTA